MKDNAVEPGDEAKESEEAPEEKVNPVRSDFLLYVSIAVVVLFIAAIFGFKYLYHPEKEVEKYRYNGFEFRNIGAMWYFKVQPKGQDLLISVPIHFGPRDLENVSITGEFDEASFNKPEIYITFDPVEGYHEENSYVGVAVSELSLSMVQGLGGVIPIAACSNNESASCADRPIKDCSSNDPVIYLKNSGVARVTMNGSCILIEGRNYELIRATDRVLMMWYGVMK